jgi:hypothetical protein
MILAIIIVIVSVLSFSLRKSGSELVKRSREIIGAKNTIGLNNGRRREKAIFSTAAQKTTTRRIGDITYEQPLDIADGRGEND